MSEITGIESGVMSRIPRIKSGIKPGVESRVPRIMSRVSRIMPRIIRVARVVWMVRMLWMRGNGTGGAVTALDTKVSGRDNEATVLGSEVTALDILMIPLGVVGIVVTEQDNVEIDIPNAQGEMRVVDVGGIDQDAEKVGLDTVSAVDIPDDQKEREGLDLLFSYDPEGHRCYQAMREDEAEDWSEPAQEDFGYSHEVHQTHRSHYLVLALALLLVGYKDYYFVIPSRAATLMEPREVHLGQTVDDDDHGVNRDGMIEEVGVEGELTGERVAVYLGRVGYPDGGDEI
ncbi:uncharacterized protein LAJ45_10373 [Morchella importuna]|uniref:uncharacterized protein n=1 Tax=Morchella importuna TaxID=1174673 RepID=UPI001E8DA3B7|nr:uncharacterized protein LAJ45_10373 [Morchella importuna]KAH8145573.1 hypothetical protein LAJ45_10373 [Morchella importuna]